MSIYSEGNWKDDIDNLIQAVTRALHTTTPSNMPYNPGQLTIDTYMIFHQKAMTPSNHEQCQRISKPQEK
jgi:hypothetical protein